MRRPLDGIVVIDFSQFLSGPYASLRLADLGARVIKIERPVGGDLCRRLYISDLELDGDSTLFHSINRNKESFSANLKDEKDREIIIQLLKKADIFIQNFRPGTIEKLGLSYNDVKKINSHLIYGSISGYGTKGPLVGKPGQDLLVQSFTGLPWFNSESGNAPIPFGLAIADMITGAHLAEGILAALVRRTITGIGAHVEVSLLESTLDSMQEKWCDFLLKQEDVRMNHKMVDLNGIYATQDGYIALSIVSREKVHHLLSILKMETVSEYLDVIENENDLKQKIKELISQKSSVHWINMFEQNGIGCSEVFCWDCLLKQDGFKILEMIQEVSRSNGVRMSTLRCPIRIDGEQFNSSVGSPKIGEHNQFILAELLNN